MRRRLGLLVATLRGGGDRVRHRAGRLAGATRRHEDEVRDRRDVPAQRPGRVLRADPGRDEGLLHVHQHARAVPTTSAASAAGRSCGSTTTTGTTPRTRRSRRGSSSRRTRSSRTFGALGTEPQQAVVDYMNHAQGAAAARLHRSDRVRQPGTRSGLYTIGWQPDYFAEGRIYGKYAAAELAEREDRRPLPERRLRQELPRGSQGRPRVEVVEHRQRGGLRRHRRERRVAGRGGYGSPEPTWSRSSRRRARRSRPTRR